MRTLSILIFITGFEGEIKMAGILQTVMDNFFSAIPEKQFEGFGSEPVAKKEKKTGLGTKPDSVYRDAYEEMEPVKDETSVVDKLANIYNNIVREENKDPETGTDRASKVSNTVSYTKGVTTVADLESQGHYVDKILRDNARDTSGKLGSNAAPINRKQNHFDVIRRAIEKHDKDTTFQDARPYRSSRGVYALEGPEALGPIAGPVKAGEKELTSYQAYIQGLKGNERFGKGVDPNEIFSPKRTPRSSRDVYALEGPEALGERGLGARPDPMTPPKADEMQIRAEDIAKKKARRNELIDSVFKAEGGYSNNKKDTGNYYKGKFVGTNHGISAPVLAKELGKAPTVADMKALTKVEAREIAAKKYYDRFSIEILPEDVQEIVFHATFMGETRGVRAMQNLLGLNPDGFIGPKTQAAMKNASFTKVEYRDAYLKELEFGTPGYSKPSGSWSTMSKGWTNRYNKLANP